MSLEPRKKYLRKEKEFKVISIEMTLKIIEKIRSSRERV